METVENLTAEVVNAEVRALEEEFAEKSATAIGNVAVKRQATVFREDESYYSD